MNIRFAALALLFASAQMTSAETLGLVLSGGGAKGAYEVGAWSALHEAGLCENIVAISGTSIGAVNAALFASWPDPKGAERLWVENLGKVFIPNDKVLQSVSKTKYAEFLNTKLREYADIAGVAVENLPKASWDAIGLEAEKEFNREGMILKNLATAFKTYRDSLVGAASDGLCDGAALRRALERSLPRDWPRATPRVYATALTSGDWRRCTFCLNQGTPEDRILRLLASTAIPVVFPPVRIDGVNYVDGGWENRGGDNVPIDPILDNHPDIETVVVVFLSDEKHLKKSTQLDRVRKSAAQKRVRLIEVIPSENIDGLLGVGLFDTSPETARRLIELGRKDARLALRQNGL